MGRIRVAQPAQLLQCQERLGVALLSLARFSLSEMECLEFLSVNPVFHAKAQAARAIAELREWGVVLRLLSGALVTHDAFIVLSAMLFEGLDSEARMAGMKKLVSIVEKSVAPGQVGRLMVYCRLLPKVGCADALADIASSLSEHIHEEGRTANLRLAEGQNRIRPDWPRPSPRVARRPAGGGTDVDVRTARKAKCFKLK
jgi:hypothetical protein